MNLVVGTKVFFPLFLEFAGRKPPWLFVCGVRVKGSCGVGLYGGFIGGVYYELCICN